jgi:hypothetical protein
MGASAERPIDLPIMSTSRPSPHLRFSQRIALRPEHAFIALEALFSDRRAAFRRRVTWSIGTLSGRTYFLDTHAPRLLTEGWRDDADLSVLTTEETLARLLSGTFDPTKPHGSDLFLWGGDAAAWKTIGEALGETRSAFAANMARLGAQVGPDSEEEIAP